LLNEAPRYEGVFGNGDLAPRVNIDSTWKWVSASRPDRFTPGERAPDALWMG